MSYFNIIISICFSTSLIEIKIEIDFMLQFWLEFLFHRRKLNHWRSTVQKIELFVLFSSQGSRLLRKLLIDNALQCRKKNFKLLQIFLQMTFFDIFLRKQWVKILNGFHFKNHYAVDKLHLQFIALSKTALGCFIPISYQNLDIGVISMIKIYRKCRRYFSKNCCHVSQVQIKIM